ncbi:uncharacterized protein MYCFIDRAFT_211502 [Pseudocercospora fijiensis CIRAD86]|uniref:Uncharacterized protein n=1 Tax=Pseudocercospora fijiensis (strain CIRAD86) TaxID=383855 RepID=M3AXU2_PSEFD|nr:uncharacterized protein MYCFIDRAFT_211502 [Pseudocercospora fijiensis CIRAD86]EME81948.1 hypothetical protein MYCFIDRAFT_211502 [Pseudocercospora fijiensis CIRAD86]
MKEESSRVGPQQQDKVSSHLLQYTTQHTLMHHTSITTMTLLSPSRIHSTTISVPDRMVTPCRSHNSYTFWAVPAQDYLLRTIQVSGHTPVEDAAATMALYLRKFPYDRVSGAAKWVPMYERKSVEDQKKEEKRYHGPQRRGHRKGKGNGK